MRTVCALVLIFILVSPSPALASPQDDELPAGAEELDSFLDMVDQELRDLLPPVSFRKMVSYVKTGEWGSLFGGVLNGVLRVFLREVVGNVHILGILLTLALITNIFYLMQGAFEHGTTSKVAFSICYLVMIGFVATSFNLALSVAREAIFNMTNFMLAILPVLLGLLGAVGGVASAALLNPLLVFIVNITAQLVESTVFPLIVCSVILYLVSSITSEHRVTGLAGLFSQAAVALLGIFLSIFLGIVSVQGVASGVADGVAVRTAKFVSGSFVPVVGKLFSDAVETVVGGTLIVKNAAGLFGVVLLVLLCAAPLLKLLALMVVYKLAGALVQPLGDQVVGEVLTRCGKCLGLVFAAVATVALMFFISITIVIAVGNFAVMVR